MLKKILMLMIVVNGLIISQALKSPDGRLEFDFMMSKGGIPYYTLKLDKEYVIKESALGIMIKDDPGFIDELAIVSTQNSNFDETWQPVLGEQKEIRNNYNQFTVTLQNIDTKKEMSIVFRLFNDGLGFRYEFPKMENQRYFTIMGEKTEFRLTGDHKTFWIPGDFDSNEYPYMTSKLSEVDAEKGQGFFEISTRRIIAHNAVQTPLMMKSDNGVYINIFEAAVTNYPVMHLLVDKSEFSLKTAFAPDAVGNIAYMQAPCSTPWRTIIVSKKAENILTSRMVLNLNEPSKISDVSWIKGQKYVGIWWELHVNKSSWNYSDINNIKLGEIDWSKVKPNGRHGATTERTKYYIDFAAKNGFAGVLVEGWNVGWEDWFGNWKENVFDFVTPYPDFDVKELQRYAASKGVKLIMHHETSASATNYERRLDEAFRFMKDNGYDAVKTGYVGRIIPRGEMHDGQWMVSHYFRVAEKAAQYKIMVNSHESSRPTGQSRTWPNWISAEAARGNEFNGWSRGNPPEHETILPFTRIMGGGMDYTPGIFQTKMDYYTTGSKFQVHTTLVKQLALYVTMYSPLQMAADLPENYERFPDAFQFIKDVAVDWDDTEVLSAEPGDYLLIARKAKGINEWFIGGITDENEREMEIAFDFLPKGTSFTAKFYMDGDGASWDENPMLYKIETKTVTSESKIKVKLARSGGVAISIK
ncbi:MAG: glycoside hydrolase family 97 protein [Ignavibacteriales bacterium]|nr:glycoside hydrolase family 97 protein [Ignavibacteriales bacterium]